MVKSQIHLYTWLLHLQNGCNCIVILYIFWSKHCLLIMSENCSMFIPSHDRRKLMCRMLCTINNKHIIYWFFFFNSSQPAISSIRIWFTSLPLCDFVSKNPRQYKPSLKSSSSSSTSSYGLLFPSPGRFYSHFQLSKYRFNFSF